MILAINTTKNEQKIINDVFNKSFLFLLFLCLSKYISSKEESIEPLSRINNILTRFIIIHVINIVIKLNPNISVYNLIEEQLINNSVITYINGINNTIHIVLSYRGNRYV